MCVCTHTPALGSDGLATQLAIVHTLPAVYAQGWLTNGVPTQVPASGPVSGHVRSVHSSVAHGTGHWGMADDPWFPACRLLLHIASPSAKAAVGTKPKTSSMSKGVVSLCGPELGPGVSTMRSNSR